MFLADILPVNGSNVSVLRIKKCLPKGSLHFEPMNCSWNDGTHFTLSFLPTEAALCKWLYCCCCKADEVASGTRLVEMLQFGKVDPSSSPITGVSLEIDL